MSMRLTGRNQKLERSRVRENGEVDCLWQEQVSVSSARTDDTGLSRRVRWWFGRSRTFVGAEAVAVHHLDEVGPVQAELSRGF